MDTKPIMNELAARLRSHRARLNWTLKDAANKSGVHFVTISKYESGNKLPTLDALYRIAGAYGIEASELLPANATGLLKSESPAKPEKKPKGKRG